MNPKLFVGGISFQSTEDSLRQAFEQAGQVVSAKIIMDKMTGRSRGFGFVEMASGEEAQAAMEMWDGKELDGREIAVKPAEDRRQD